MLNQSTETEQLREAVVYALSELTRCKEAYADAEELNWFLDHPKLRATADAAIERCRIRYEEALQRFQSASQQA